MKIVRIMLKFYNIKLFLICISAIIANCEKVMEESEAGVGDKILPLSHIATITDGKMERNKRGLMDYLLSELYEYFDYSDKDDTDKDEKYLICRNCTVVVSQSGNQDIQPTKPNGAPTNMETGNKVTNGEGKPPTDSSSMAMKPAAVSNSNGSPVMAPADESMAGKV